MRTLYPASIAQAPVLSLLMILGGVVAGACSDEKEPTDKDNAATTPVENAFDLTPPKLYSAFVPNRMFSVPVRADVRVKEWKCSDPTAVTFETTGDRTVEVRINKAGPPVTITAVAPNNFTASAVLTVTAATEEQWQAGSARFNNGKPALPRPDTFEDREGLEQQFAEAIRNMMPIEAALFKKDGACFDCHGEHTSADPEMFGFSPVTIRNTPAQIGRYSDDEVKTIITLGTKPRGVDTSSELFGTRVAWRYAHRWEATPEQLDGLVVYLRSLPPVEQESFDEGHQGPDGRRRPRKPEEPPPEEIPPEDLPPEDLPPDPPTDTPSADAGAADGAVAPSDAG